jgi:hypothetical protein
VRISRIGLTLAVATSLLGVSAPVGGAQKCSDCDLVLAESDLPDGYSFDAKSPERDRSGSARSIRLDDCVVAEKLDKEHPGLERQSAIFVAGDDPLGGDENVIRFASVKQARRFAAAFDDYLRDGPQCGVVNARGDDGEVFELARIEALDLGSVGDRSAAIASDSPIEGVPDRFLAIVRTGRAVILVEAFESAQIDEARFVQLVDAVAAAS